MFKKQTPVVTNCWELKAPLTLYLDEASIGPHCIKQIEALGRLSGPAQAAEQYLGTIYSWQRRSTHRVSPFLLVLASSLIHKEAQMPTLLSISHLTFRREATGGQKPSRNVPSMQRLLPVPHLVFSPSRVIDFLARHRVIQNWGSFPSVPCSWVWPWN